MPLRRTKLYPTPTNCQYTNETTWPLGGVLSYFQILHDQIPEDERASATVEFQGGVPAIYWDHHLSQQESDRERMMLLYNDLERRAQSKQGLSAEEVEELIKQFHTLA